MKNLKKLFIVVLSALMITTNTFAATNLNIVSVTANEVDSVKVLLDGEIISENTVLEGDAKVFKDIKVETLEADLDSNNKLNVSLTEALEANSSYSFLSVRGVDWNMDFMLWDEVIWVELDNPLSSENVEKIFIKDSKNIIITFSKEITETEIEVKVLKELSVASIELNTENKTELNLVMQDALEISSKYILMMFSLNLSEEEEISFADGIFEFETDENFSVSEETTGETTWEAEVSETGEALSWEVEEVALNAAATPETWTATWILISLTFFMSSVIFVRRKFKK